LAIQATPIHQQPWHRQDGLLPAAMHTCRGRFAHVPMRRSAGCCAASAMHAALFLRLRFGGLLPALPAASAGATCWGSLPSSAYNHVLSCATTLQRLTEANPWQVLNSRSTTALPRGKVRSLLLLADGCALGLLHSEVVTGGYCAACRTVRGLSTPLLPFLPVVPSDHLLLRSLRQHHASSLGCC
jgi:hypothetical protein